MIKVLMCGNHLTNKGGMTSVIKQILKYDWNKKNIQLDFLPTYLPGFKIKTIVFFICAYIKLIFIFLFNKPDVFYTHMSYKGSYARTKLLHRLCKKFHIKDIIHLHGSEFKDWYLSSTKEKQKSIKALIEECSTFIVLGEKGEKFVKKIAPEANIVKVHNCIDIPKEHTICEERKIRCLYLGVLIKRKGVIDLLKAVHLLMDQKLCDNFEFFIGGTGEEERYLKDYVNDNKMNKYIKFLGWIDGAEKNCLIRKSQIFILPSYNEGLPVSILEAMGYGLPIISTDVGDISDAVHNGINGYLYKAGDIATLAEKIVSLSDSKKWNDFSSSSRKIAEEEFSINLFYNNLSNIWRNVYYEMCN